MSGLLLQREAANTHIKEALIKKKSTRFYQFVNKALGLTYIEFVRLAVSDYRFPDITTKVQKCHKSAISIKFSNLHKNSLKKLQTLTHD